jgi:hypothetical protein
VPRLALMPHSRWFMVAGIARYLISATRSTMPPRTRIAPSRKSWMRWASAAGNCLRSTRMFFPARRASAIAPASATDWRPERNEVGPLGELCHVPSQRDSLRDGATAAATQSRVQGGASRTRIHEPPGGEVHVPQLPEAWVRPGASGHPDRPAHVRPLDRASGRSGRRPRPVRRAIARARAGAWPGAPGYPCSPAPISPAGAGEAGSRP